MASFLAGHCSARAGSRLEARVTRKRVTRKRITGRSSDAPFAVFPLSYHGVVGEIELERRDGDVSIPQCRDVGVLVALAEGEDGVVPVVGLAAGVFAFFVGVDPGVGALADDADADR